MMVQTNFAENIVDDLLNEMLNIPVMNKPVSRIKRPMHTDVKEFKDRYEFEIELPGFNKDEIKADLKNGNLTIVAEKAAETSLASEDGKYIRKERYTGRCERNFVIDKKVKKEEVAASFTDGILKITVPKVEVEVEENSTINIL